MPCWVLVLVCACGRVAFEPLDDGAVDTMLPGDDSNHLACLTNPAYATAAGLTNRYREGVPLISWAEARVMCEAEGAYLWIPDSALEQAAWTGDWTGITDADAEGTWETVTNQPATFLPWQSGQPDGGTGENCVRSDAAGFEDRDCNDLRDFVCECPTD
jgi:hypothetical protein